MPPGALATQQAVGGVADRAGAHAAPLVTTRRHPVEPVLGQQGAARQEGQLQQHRDADDVGPQPADQAGGGDGGAPGGEHVVHDEHPVAGAHRVHVQGQRLLAVLEGVGDLDGLPGQLARLADRDEPDTQGQGDRRAEEEATGLQADHDVDPGRSGAHQRRDGGREPVRRGQQRGHVLEHHPGPGEVGHVDDQGGEVDHHAPVSSDAGCGACAAAADAWPHPRRPDAPATDPATAPRDREGSRTGSRGLAAAGSAVGRLTLGGPGARLLLGSTVRHPGRQLLHLRVALLDLGQQRGGDEDRGVGAGDHADEQGEREVLERPLAEDDRSGEQQGRHRQHADDRGVDRADQHLVDRQVGGLGVGLGGAGAQAADVLADLVEDHHGVVEGVPEDGQHADQRGRGDGEPDEGVDADRQQQVVGQGHQRGDRHRAVAEVDPDHQPDQDEEDPEGDQPTVGDLLAPGGADEVVGHLVGRHARLLADDGPHLRHLVGGVQGAGLDPHLVVRRWC